eukprot:CAMPEP_0119186398 /NCGR_PEP_ID=MMETSP1315-20130426/68996_1 /TAXON_ID=676789 /ORGANISM="Prasinoderma singularis, Strain RCC927" /LENGTH=245 /DNA_ID=CAMNT_0007180835 /DNA_START=356 /DNA_END=1094 /DNA_ORIENTATION=-
MPCALPGCPQTRVHSHSPPRPVEAHGASLSTSKPQRSLPRATSAASAALKKSSSSAAVGAPKSAAASRAAWAAPGASARGDSLSAPPLPRAPPARPHCPLPRGPHRGPAPAAARRAAAAALAPPGALAVSSTWWLSRPTARAAPAPRRWPRLLAAQRARTDKRRQAARAAGCARGTLDVVAVPPHSTRGACGRGGARRPWSEQAADSVRKLRCERALALIRVENIPPFDVQLADPRAADSRGGAA